MPLPRSSNKLPVEPAVALAEWSFKAIGTSWWVGIYQPISPKRFLELKKQIAARVGVFDKTYSRFRKNSLVTKISQRAGEFVFPEDSLPLFAMYRRLYDISNGLVTPLIGGSLSDTGYDADYSLRPGPVQPVPKWDAVMTFDRGRLHTTRPVLLDFGAAGKGYLVDILSELLFSRGISAFCIDGSGDMVCRGLDSPVRIGLEHPDDMKQAIGIVELYDGALCGSAGNRRAWAGYNHVLNPRTLRSEVRLKATWASASSTLIADGLATALFFVSPEVLEKQFEFNWLVVYADNSMKHSTSFPATLFGSTE